jgi:prepilin-type processing-associated H-X9-DG protein
MKFSIILVCLVTLELLGCSREPTNASNDTTFPPSTDKPKTIQITCVNNLKQMGLAFRIWSGDNEDKFPFNVATNLGGTMEFCALGRDGLDNNSALHLQVMSNEVSNPRILICPQDEAKKPARDFQQLTAANVTYRLHSGTNVIESDSKAILAVCPIDGNTLFCDGSVSNHVPSLGR